MQYIHSRHSCLCVCPSLCKWDLRVVWPVNSPTAALSLKQLTVRSSLALLDRGYLTSILDCRQTVQVAQLSWCLSSKSFCMIFSYTKGYSSEIIKWNFDSPFLSQSVCLLIGPVSLDAQLYTLKFLLSSLNFPSTCIYSQTKDNPVERC